MQNLLSVFLAENQRSLSRRILTVVLARVEGVSNFAVACSLVAAIEAAGTLLGWAGLGGTACPVLTKCSYRNIFYVQTIKRP